MSFLRSVSVPLSKVLPPFLLLFCLLLSGCDRREADRPAGNTAPQPSYRGTIIAVGDSLTAGLGVAEKDAWPALVARELAEDGFNWQVINAGISGETSSGMLGRIKWIAAQRPDIVILATGANDGLRGIPPAVIRENISKAVEMLKQSNITVVLAGMQIVQNLGPEYTNEFAAVYPEVAAEHGVPLIPFLLENVAGEPSRNQADAIHPNEAGHAIIAETVYPSILQAVSARGGRN